MRRYLCLALLLLCAALLILACSSESSEQNEGSGEQGSAAVTGDTMVDTLKADSGGTSNGTATEEPGDSMIDTLKKAKEKSEEEHK
jgi:hypothetical protein